MTKELVKKGDMVYFQDALGKTFPAVVLDRHPEPDTHLLDLYSFGDGLRPCEFWRGVPFGIEPHTWSFR